VQVRQSQPQSQLGRALLVTDLSTAVSRQAIVPEGLVRPGQVLLIMVVMGQHSWHHGRRDNVLELHLASWRACIETGSLDGG
jgi:hypothetical protein